MDPCAGGVVEHSAAVSDRLALELLRVARQWVVLRFLADAEARLGRPVSLLQFENETLERKVLLYEALHELCAQRLIRWVGNGPMSLFDGSIQLTPDGRSYTARVAERLREISLKHTMDDCRCGSLGEVVDVLENRFHRINA